MKKTLVAAAASLLLAAVSFAGTPANYSGTWKLDLASSKHLPSVYKDLTGGQINVTQDDKQVAVDVSMQTKTDGSEFKKSMVYKLDGSETTSEVAINTGSGMQNVPSTLRGAALPSGQLLLTQTHQVTVNSKTWESTSAERWTLSADQKTLTVHRRDNLPKGAVEYDMVFTRS